MHAMSSVDTRLLKARLAAAASYAVVALGFYLLSLIIPPLLSGVGIPGIPPPFSSLERLFWVFLFLLSLAFAATALYNFIRAVDPFFALVSRRIGGAAEPGKRIVRDLAYALLAVLIAAAVTPFTEGVDALGSTLRVAIGLMTLAVLVILLYDAARTIYTYARERIEGLIEKLAG